MKEYVLATTEQAFTQYDDKKEIVKYISDELTDKYDKYWICIIGIDEAFMYYVWNEPNNYISFTLGNLKVSIFRTPDDSLFGSIF